MPQLPPQEYTSVGSGLITKSAVSKYKLPLDSVVLAVNMHFDKIGSATLRKGVTQLGNTISSTDILGLHNFRDSGTGTNDKIVAVNGTAAYYLNSATWTSKREGLTNGKKARFTTFLDFEWMVNGSEATAIWNGDPVSNFSTGGNASGAPIGKFVENFRSRVWILGNDTYPDRVWYSSLPSAATTPVITWDTDVATGDWIDISPSDGENITGGKRTKRALLVFKQNHIYRIYSINETEPDPSINVGTYSHESIVEAKDGGTYFHHPTGFYRYSDGGVQEISKPIKDIVEAIALSEYENIAGWIESGGDAVCWSIGDVTIYDNVTITNAVVRYTISTQSWTLYSYATRPLVGIIYENSSSDASEAVWGNSAGQIMRHNIGNDDAGTPVRYEIIHRPYLVDGLNATEKNIENVMFIHDGGGSDTSIQWQKENDLESDWTKSLGSLNDRNTLFPNADIRCNEVTFRASGVSSGEPFTYYGFEIIDSDSTVNYAK